jgi:hypothetical protein
MNEFSDVGSEMSHTKNINLVKTKSEYLQYKNNDSSGSSGFDLEEINKDLEEDLKKKRKMRRMTTIGTLMENVLKNCDAFKDIDKRSFNIFEVAKQVGRDHLLPTMSL